MQTLAKYMREKQRIGCFFPPETIKIVKKRSYRCDLCGCRFHTDQVALYSGMAPDPEDALQTTEGVHAVVNCPQCGYRIQAENPEKSKIKKQKSARRLWIKIGLILILLGTAALSWEGRRVFAQGEEAYAVQDMVTAREAYRQSSLIGLLGTAGKSAGKYAWCLAAGMGGEVDLEKAAGYARLAKLFGDAYGYAASAEIAFQTRTAKPQEILEECSAFIKKENKIEPLVYHRAVETADTMEEEEASSLEYTLLAALTEELPLQAYQEVYDSTAAQYAGKAEALAADCAANGWIHMQRQAEQEAADSWIGWYMGRCYWLGRGVQRDDTAALTWWLNAARQGNGQAAAQLALLYYNGGAGYGCDLVKENKSLALDLAWDSVQRGREEALWVLSNFYGQESNPEDQEFIWTLLTDAAAQGSGEASWLMGNFYREGVVGEANSEENNKMALDCYQKAVEQGCMKAERTLGILYYNGAMGLDRDTEKGCEKLEAAAEAGDGTALYTLAQLYQQQGDHEKAKEYLLHAAELRPGNYAMIREDAWAVYQIRL